MSATIVGVFANCEHAEQALIGLQRRGFPDHEIGLVSDQGELIIQSFVLAKADVADRGLRAVLQDMGVPEGPAAHFAHELGAYSTVLTVTTGDRAPEAKTILRRYGAREMSSFSFQPIHDRN
jgi:hypothetical protein